ncbi:FAD/NAD(P)-binding domain-containing protein [Corynespora cassiicola Philippines]|uniref:FAD/NAD(P)-binding domain-containing protein n=1 Tax=Corynespora cassiicola Philippines TaxID=1448308 RepID=A0A2T2N783_CORCC|nr:FAD/NAD(P)-binding domain-containing protein [Corynespora cassiicola Philippines]
MAILPQLKILISGAGIAGPCLAYWLTRTRNAPSIKILERSPSPRVTGQAVDIRGGGINILKRMGLEDELRARHTTEKGTEILNAQGKPFAQFGVGEIFTAEHEILRADLAELFLDAIKDKKGVVSQYGDYIKALVQSADGVKVTYASGGMETFDVVVAADGLSSTTRPLIIDEKTIKGSYRFMDQYQAFFSIPRQPNDSRTWKWYNAPKGLGIMIRPHRSPETVGAYLSVTMAKHGDRDPVLEETMNKGTDDKKQTLRKYFENAGWEAERVLNGMDKSEDFYMTREARIKLSKWTNGRAVLLGDAAFATMGIGTTFAIQSAYVLAGELSKVEKSSDVANALERYEQVFRSISDRYGNLPAGYSQFVFPQTAVGLTLRNLFIWALYRSRVYKIIGEGWGEDECEIPEYDWMDG